MTAASDGRDTKFSPLFEPPHLVADALRYGTAMALVAAVAGGLGVVIGHTPVTSEASEADSALLVDLPPAEASSRPQSEAAETAQAVAAQPRRVETQTKPPDTPRIQPPNEVKDEPAPAAPLEPKAEPPQPVEAPPPSAAQTAQAPAEAASRADVDDSSGDEGTPHASARQITLWQQALMKRLEAAKRAHRRAVTTTGTARVVFEIDRQGAVTSTHVVASSGSVALDGAAIALVKNASPFPGPPPGAGKKDMSFVVPIRFKR